MKMQDKGVGVEPDLVTFIFSSVVLCHQAFSSNISNFGGSKFWSSMIKVFANGCFYLLGLV
jgi:amino acid permease